MNPGVRWDLSWRLTRYEDLLVSLLCAERGIDAHAARMVALSYRCEWDRSPWWDWIEPHIETLHRQWLEDLGAERGGQVVCGDPFGLWESPGLVSAGGWE